MPTTSVLAAKAKAVLGWLFDHSALVLRPLMLLNRRTVLRCLYSADLIRSKVILRVSGDNDGLIVHAYPSHAAVNVHLLVTNHAPFPVTIDRVTGYFKVGHTRVAIHPVRQLTVPGNKDGTLYMQGELLGEHVERIAAQLHADQTPDCAIEAEEIIVLAGTGETVSLYHRTMNAAHRRFMGYEQLRARRA